LGQLYYLEAAYEKYITFDFIEFKAAELCLAEFISRPVIELKCIPAAINFILVCEKSSIELCDF